MLKHPRKVGGLSLQGCIFVFEAVPPFWLFQDSGFKSRGVIRISHFRLVQQSPVPKDSKRIERILSRKELKRVRLTFKKSCFDEESVLTMPMVKFLSLPQEINFAFLGYNGNVNEIERRS